MNSAIKNIIAKHYGNECADELLRYNEPHRFYHNGKHITDLLVKAFDKNMLTETFEPHDLFLAIVFHDIIYDPRRTDNEELSAELFSRYIKNDVVHQAILDTKTHKPSNPISKQLCELDLDILYNGDYDAFIDFENKIFKEYQFVDFNIYRSKRIEILKELGADKEFGRYVRYRKPNIGVFAGSFNPFHKGHMNILQKAEKLFDKVIIARGCNPEKNNELLPMPKSLQFHQIENYSGLLTDFIDSLGYEVTLIRSLRNANDFDYELTQYRFLQDLKPNINMVSLFCDKEYSHISSSSIRQLKKFNKENDYLA